MISELIERNKRVIDILENEDITMKSIDAIQILRGSNEILKKAKATGEEERC